MKIRKGFLVLGAALLLVGQAQAQSHFSYDIFGMYTTDDKDGSGHDRLGLGAGVNYFFNMNMGVGLDTYTDDVVWPYLLNGSFIYRFAQLKPIMPYGYAGVGRQWAHSPQWMGHLGGGAQYELTQGTSVFADARLVLPDKTDNYGVIRVGVRFDF